MAPERENLDPEIGELADLALAGTDPDRVITLAAHVLEREPAQSIALAARGVAFHQLQRRADTTTELIRAGEAASADYEMWSRLVDFLQRAGLVDELLSGLTQRTLEDATKPEPWLLLGRAQRFAGRLTDAVDSFAHATSTTSMSGETWFELAWTASDAEKPNESLAALDKIVEIEPNDDRGAVIGLRAIALTKLGRAREAAAALTSLTDVELRDGGSFARRAAAEVITALADGDLNAEVVDLFERVSSAIADWRPSEPELFFVGRALVAIGRPNEALSKLQAAETTAHEELKAVAAFWHAVSLSAVKQFEAALAKVDEAIPSLRPAAILAAAHATRALVLNGLGRYGEALDATGKVDESAAEPTVWSATLLHRGIALANLKRPAEAITVLEEAARSAGADAMRWEILFLLAGLYAAARDFDRALDATTSALTKNIPAEQRPTVLYSKGLLTFKAGNAEEALQIVAEAIQLAGGAVQTDWRIEQAGIAESLGRAADAIAYTEGLTTDGPDQEAQLLSIRARALVSLGRHSEAADTFDRLVSVKPDLERDAGFVRFRCDVLLAAKRTDEAIAMLERAAKQYPNVGAHPYVPFTLGELRRNAGGSIDELLAAARVAAIVPAEYEKDATAWLVSGISLVGLQQWAQAKNSFARFEELEPNGAVLPAPRLYKAIMLIGLGANEAALAQLDGLPSGSVGADGLADTMRGQALAGLRRHEDAISAFDRALEQSRTGGVNDSTIVATALTGKANALLSMGRFAEALPVFEASWPAITRSGMGDHVLGVVVRSTQALALHRVHRTDEALQLLDEAMSVSAKLPRDMPFRGLAWWFKAILLVELDRDEEAVPLCRRAELEGMPGNEALTLQGTALLALQDYDGALATFRRAIERAADADERFEALSGEGRALHWRGEYVKAVASYRAAIDIERTGSPNDWIVWQRLGEAYDALERPRGALGAYQRAWALDQRAKRSVDIAVAVSAKMLNLGQHEDARQFLQKARRLTKPDPRLDYNFGIASLQLDDVESAKEAFRKAAKGGIDAAASVLAKLERKLTSQTAWAEFWFGKAASVGKRVLGGSLLIFAASVLMAPVALYLVTKTLDWKLLLAPPLVALVLLVLPGLKNVSVALGDLKLQAEPAAATGTETPELSTSVLARSAASLLSAAPSLSGQSSAVELDVVSVSRRTSGSWAAWPT